MHLRLAARHGHPCARKAGLAALCFNLDSLAVAACPHGGQGWLGEKGFAARSRLPHLRSSHYLFASLSGSLLFRRVTSMPCFLAKDDCLLPIMPTLQRDRNDRRTQGGLLAVLPTRPPGQLRSIEAPGRSFEVSHCQSARTATSRRNQSPSRIRRPRILSITRLPSLRNDLPPNSTQRLRNGR